VDHDGVYGAVGWVLWVKWGRVSSCWIGLGFFLSLGRGGLALSQSHVRAEVG
jgi:hypothetical protein